jgi:hypothetical protein
LSHALSASTVFLLLFGKKQSLSWDVAPNSAKAHANVILAQLRRKRTRGDYENNENKEEEKTEQ